MSELSEKLMLKLKASSIHLGLSFLVFIVILYFILFEWYPEPFFTAQGGWLGIQIMAFVDLVLGPALTFIVFNHLKPRKEIIFDLSIVVVVQIAALLWGGYNVYTQRPVALVFWANAFYTVTSVDYSDQGIENPDFSRYSRNVPALIYSRPVTTRLENTVSMELTSKQIPVYAQVMFYEPFIENHSEVFKYQIDIDEVISRHVDLKADLHELVGDDVNRYNYIMLNAKYQNMILVFDDDGNLIGEVKTPNHDRVTGWTSMSAGFQ